ncbi:LexA family protein [Acidithiobacillus ferriphilus]|uniref:LexA family protein n=1 Tax=Acidithiobacillus ferriphilus TaxID=1689834 RepID=UPI003F512088
MSLDAAIIEKLSKVGLTVMRPDVHAPSASMPLFISMVAAGFPSPADDYVEKALDLNEYCMPNRSGSFFLRVTGHSMTGAGIHDGDILVVDRSITPKSGNVVIAVLDGELTVKRMVRKGGMVLLMPENKDYPVITIDQEQDFLVWGTVTFVVHKL